MISFAKITASEQPQNKKELNFSLKNQIVIDNIDQTNKPSYVHVIHNPHGKVIQRTIKQSSLHKAIQINNSQVVQQKKQNLKVEIIEEPQKRLKSPIQKLISEEVVQIKQKQIISQNKSVQINKSQINKSPRRTKPIFPKIQQNSKQKQQIQQQSASFISIKPKNLNKQKVQINEYSHIQAFDQQDMGCSIFSEFLSRKSVIRTNIHQNGQNHINERSLSHRKKIFSKQKVTPRDQIKKQQTLKELIKLRAKQRKKSTDIKQASTRIKKLVNQSNQQQNIEPSKPMIKKLGGNRQTIKNLDAFSKLVQIQITKLASINPLYF